MDIKNLTTNGLSGRVAENASSTGKGHNAGAEKSSAKAADTVTLTSSVQNLEQKASHSNVDNSQRIAELKQAIKDGSYQVNAENVASKLIETEALLAGA